MTYIINRLSQPGRLQHPPLRPSHTTSARHSIRVQTLAAAAVILGLGMIRAAGWGGPAWRDAQPLHSPSGYPAPVPDDPFPRIPDEGTPAWAPSDLPPLYADQAYPPPDTDNTLLPVPDPALPLWFDVLYPAQPSAVGDGRGPMWKRPTAPGPQWKGSASSGPRSEGEDVR